MAAQQFVESLSIPPPTQLAVRGRRNAVVALQNRPVLVCQHKIATRLRKFAILVMNPEDRSHATACVNFFSRK